MKIAALALPLVSFAVGCASAPPADDRASSNVRAPMELEGATDSVWVYLAAQYDVDGDGQIAVAEYGRSETSFARLDRDGNGILSSADFAQSSGDPMAEMIAEMRATMAMARYLQEEGDPSVLSIEELEASLLAYDADGDYGVDQAEFAAQSAARAVELTPAMIRLEDMDLGGEPWVALQDGLDEDRDGILTIEEVMAFFEAHEDGSGAWDLEATAIEITGGTESPDEGSSASMPMNGPAEGSVAPDFTIAQLHGGPPVTLSSFKDDAPVALVFGSYT